MGVAGSTEKQVIHFADRHQIHIYDEAIKVKY
jgi:hypothetical protein